MSITTQRITPFLLLFLLLQLVLCSAQDPIYKVVQLEENPSGFTGELKRVSGSSPYGNNVDYLSLQVEYLTSSIVHVKITDVEKKRWQVPLPVGPFERNEGEALNYKVKVPAVDEQFNFQIFSSVPGQASYPVFDTTDLPFIFSDQYIQFGSSLPGDCKGACEPNIYGLGERVDSLKLDTNNKTYTIWNHDNLDIPKTNLYGQHPFYLEMRNGLAHGAFLLNSNAMDIQLNWKKGGASNQIIYKVIGGVIDLYFMVGPKPMDVVRQYQEIIGKPFMPPFWVFGFHQCRWGYKNIDETMNVVEQYQIHDIPLETMWNDIDYMDHYKDFTFDPVKFPMNKMKQFTDMLRQNGQHYIVIVDPGIKTEKGYPAYDLLIDQKLYIATADGKTPLQNIVWPGYTVFPDFTNDKTHDYWRQQIHKFFDLGVEIDALWIDMNEPGTFCNGQCYPQNERPPVAAPTRAKSTFDPTNPPYTPGIYPLEHKTLSLNATTSMGPFYNTHSLYGYLESIATRDAITSYPRKKNQRPFVLSRSSFAGSGKHVAHWTGDNYSTYESMKYSISGIISMQLFGITMVGSDICGFTGNTTEELCTRWMQLGSFYPFSRNHNAEGYASQEPYMFGQKLIEVSRRYLLQRYSLLQWYYTVFFRVNQQGGFLELLVDGVPTRRNYIEH